MRYIYNSAKGSLTFISVNANMSVVQESDSKCVPNAIFYIKMIWGQSASFINLEKKSISYLIAIYIYSIIMVLFNIFFS